MKSEMLKTEIGAKGLRDNETTDHRTTEDRTTGSILLNDLRHTLNRFVVLPQWAPETLALWILHTYAFHLRDVTTYLGLESREKRCGKTTLVTVLAELVNRPEVAANISSSAFFRIIQENQPTLLIDEADTLLPGNDELRGILNSGYTCAKGYLKSDFRDTFPRYIPASEMEDVRARPIPTKAPEPPAPPDAPPGTEWPGRPNASPPIHSQHRAPGLAS
jgi:hypothetical protein